MKRLVTSLCFLLFIQSAYSQIKAVTESGDEVVLNDDGTWEYTNGSASQEVAKVDTNSMKFTKNTQANFLVKSKKVNCGIYINPKSWGFEKSDSEDAQEFSFNCKEKDIYAMLITEKIEIPLETLEEIAVQNAKKAAPDIKVIKHEYRTVNDKMVLFIQMQGSYKGIKFTYLGYYYSWPSGTIQFVAYTSSSLVDEYKKDILDFLNGFTITE